MPPNGAALTENHRTIGRLAVLLYGLRAARLAAGLSGPDLATRVGMSRETLSRLEHLHRATTQPTVRSLAAALDVPADMLTRPPAVAQSD